ncbi:MAG: AAA family ATPase [Polyangiaceae bacterium]
MSSPSHLENALPGNRFEVRRLLGWGGMGVVYEAYDRVRRARVAIKTLRSMDAAGLLRFKNEFRSLVDLSHPNLVRLGELLEDGGQLFFTMELVSGIPFIDHVRGTDAAPEPGPVSRSQLDTAVRPASRPPPESAPRAADGAFDEEKLREALVQLARGLGALHASGRVVILDFGLVTEATDTLGDDEVHVVGTAHFMAPEQAAGRSVGAPADWYAVGVMLYLAMTGMLPFEVSSDAVGKLKQRAVPLPPSAVVPGLPADLDALAMHLLRIEPRERAGEREILLTLGDARCPVSATSSPGAPGFVGRRRELVEIRRAFEGALAGEVRACIVEGESGMGKTTLARRFLDDVSESALVLAARCYERESVPYKAVDGIVDRVGTHLSKLPHDEALALLPADIGLAATVFPVLALSAPVAERAAPPPPSPGAPALGDKGLVLDLLDDDERARKEPGFLGPAAAAPEIEPAELRARVFTAMRQLFLSLAAQRPLVLAIDDLQWADADSLALLAELLRPASAGDRAPTKAPIFLLASVRTGTEVTRATVVGLGLAPRLVRTIQLTRLPPEEARDLVEQLLRVLAAGVPIDASIDVGALLAEGSGHPLFLDALVRHRLANAEGSAPVRLDDALWARMLGLPPRARMLLTVLSLAGGPVARAVAQHALSADADEIDRLLADLRAEHFTRAAGSGEAESFEPYHDRIRETAVARLDEAELRGWHARLALALETMGSGELEELCVHWLGAGDLSRAADYAARAGDEAAAAFAFDRAARLYRQAISHLPEAAPERPSLLVRLGDALGNGGRGHDAAKAYVAAAALYPEPSAVELRRRAAENLLRSGYIDEGMEHLRAVLGAVDLDFPATPATALAALLFRRTELRLRGLTFPDMAPGRARQDDLRRADVCWSASMGLGMVDSLRGAYFQTRSLLFALSAGDPYRVSRALSMELAFVATAGPGARPRVDELRAAAQRNAERSRHPHALALVPGVSGVALFLEGHFREAIPLLTESAHALRNRCIGAHWEWASITTFHLWCLWFSGDLRGLVARAPEVIREAEERGDRYLATNLCSSFTNALWLVAGDPETASARAAGAIRPWARAGSHLQHFHDLVARVHIALYVGDGAEAHRAISEGWKALDESMSLRVQIVRVMSEHLRGAAAVSAAGVALDRSTGVSAAVRAARRIESERLAWAAPLAALLRAGAKARDGQSGAAVTSLLEEAARGADAAGLRAYAIAARRAIGVVRGGPDGARLIAEADADLTALGVVDPPRFSRVLTPGFDT